MFGLIVLTALVVILILKFSYWFHKRSVRRKIINKIPGPPEHPIFGVLLDLLVPPEDIWNYVRKLAVDFYPIYQFWQVAVPTVNLINPEDIEVILSTTKHTRKSIIYHFLHPWLGRGLLTSAGNKWQGRRKLLTPTFHFSILQEFIGVFVESSELLVKELEKECDKPHTNIVPIITKFTLHSVCETALGTKLDMNDKKWQEYAKAVYRFGELVLFRLTRPWNVSKFIYFLSPNSWEQKKVVNILHNFSKSIIKNRKATFKEPELQESQKLDDGLPKRRLAMLDLLIAAQKAGEPIDDEGIREEVDTFMFEGHDTTTACLSFTLLLLACHKYVQDLVVQELDEVFGDSDRAPTLQDLQNLKYLDRVLKESLRLYPSVPFISRVSDEEIQTPSGYTIPANTVLQLHIYDLHRHPKHFPEPDIFDPDRFLPENSKGRHPFVYVPFSAGPRNCIGQKFAIFEIKTMVSAVLRKFVLKPIDTPSDITMVVHLVLKTKNGIRIKFEERHKS